MEPGRVDHYLAQLFEPTETVPLVKRSLENMFEIPFEYIRQISGQQSEPSSFLPSATAHGEALVKWWLSRKQLIDKVTPGAYTEGSCEMDDGGTMTVVRGHEDFKHAEFEDGLDTLNLTYRRGPKFGHLYVGRWTSHNQLDLQAARPKIRLFRDPTAENTSRYNEYEFTMFGDIIQSLSRKTIHPGKGVVPQKIAVPIPGYNLSPQI